MTFRNENVSITTRLKKMKVIIAEKKLTSQIIGYVFSAMLATFIPTNKYLKKAFYC